MNFYRLATAAFTGLLCGLWGGFAGLMDLSAWAGFAGCTAYFACGIRLIPGAALTVSSSFAGVGCAWLMLQGADLLGSANSAYAVSVGFFVMCIVLLGRFKWTSFVPGTFVGCYSLFAIKDNDWVVLLASLAVGVLLGLVCDWGGSTIFARWKPGTDAEPVGQES
ncbi:DUF1097 domain-containing protein [Streptomyces sp. NPDC001698]|uniref:DUF1097 domain-containing protein n=1 Tax=unclassified Streptomyces TaxID=2593676 RepID=UPI00340F4505